MKREPTESEKAAFEELYKEAVRAKARRGMARKAALGIQHGCAPLGYMNVTVNGERVMVTDPETAPKVRELFRLSQKKGMTIRKLVPLAAGMGLRSRNGKPLGASSIHAILRNPFYMGEMISSGCPTAGWHGPLISIDEFERARKGFASRRRH